MKEAVEFPLVRATIFFKKIVQKTILLSIYTVRRIAWFWF